MIHVNSVMSITPPKFPSVNFKCMNNNKIFLLCSEAHKIQLTYSKVMEPITWLNIVMVVLHLQLSRFMSLVLCRISKSTININEDHIENRTSPDLLTVIGSACLLIS